MNASEWAAWVSAATGVATLIVAVVVGWVGWKTFIKESGQKRIEQASLVGLWFETNSDKIKSLRARNASQQTIANAQVSISVNGKTELRTALSIEPGGQAVEIDIEPELLKKLNEKTRSGFNNLVFAFLVFSDSIGVKWMRTTTRDGSELVEITSNGWVTYSGVLE